LYLIIKTILKNMKSVSLFDKFIKENVGKTKPKIGFGLKEPDKEVLKSLVKSKKYAEIVLVGPDAIKNVKGFEKVISNEPEKKIAEILAKGEVEGIIRGTIDDFKTVEAYEAIVGKDKTKNMAEFGLLEDACGRQFFISEASNPKGWTREEKMDSLGRTVGFMINELGLKPKIGFLTGVRHDTYTRRKGSQEWPIKYLNETYEDAEYGVKYYTGKGIEAKNYAIEVNAAVEDGCNIVVPPNGMAGNQIFRALCLIGGGRILSAVRGNLPHIYEDNSRNERNFETHVKWLVAWINRRKRKAGSTI
jgi:predicted methyltransferase MtxX (methanogen marker protein 4)